MKEFEKGQFITSKHKIKSAFDHNWDTPIKKPTMTLYFVEWWYDPLTNDGWATVLFNGKRFVYKLSFREQLLSKHPVWRIQGVQI